MKSFREKCKIPFCITVTITILFAVSQAFAETYQYDSAGRLTSIIYDDGSAIDYQYDNAGNIKKISKATSHDNDIPNSSDNDSSDENLDISNVGSTTTTTSNSPCFVGTLKYSIDL